MIPREFARRRLHSQLLEGPPAMDAAAVVDHLLCVQAENASQSLWALGTRAAPTAPDRIQKALDDGTILRTHALRMTWHYVRAEDAAWVLELTRPRVERGYERQLAAEGIDRDGWQRCVALLEEAVRGTALARRELAERLAAAGEVLSAHALMVVCAVAEVHGVLVSGPVRDGEQTYALLAERAPSSRRLDRDEALAELALRYISGHGPATERDLAYWASLPLGDVRRGIAGSDLRPVEHDGRTFWERADAAPGDPGPGRGHLLQILDEYYRGYQDSRDLLDLAGRKPPGRDRAIGMAVVDGQVVGDMTRTLGDGTVRFDVRPFVRLTRSEQAELSDAAERYAAFLGVPGRLEILDP